MKMVILEKIFWYKNGLYHIEDDLINYAIFSYYENGKIKYEKLYSSR